MGACCSACKRKPAEGEEHKDHGMIPDGQRKCRDVFCCILFALFCT